MVTRGSLSPDLSVADKLDDEIANLRAQVEALKRDLRLQSATILTSDSTRELLARRDSDSGRQQQQQQQRSSTSADRALREKLLARADEHVAHKQQCLYRACASITTFKVRDPDPNAVDGGSVLGLRFEIMSRASFLRPYYVMVNRPYADSRHLRVHRHTVPPSIPLVGLAARYLPPPTPTVKDDVASDKLRSQDLSRFARALRRELVRYHNRIAVIADLRKAVGLDGKKGGAEAEEAESDNNVTRIVNVSAADAEAKQIRIEWKDGRTGRLIMNGDGDIMKMAVRGENAQDRQAVREFLGGSVRIEEVTKRLQPA